MANGTEADPRFRLADDGSEVMWAHIRDVWTRQEPFPHCWLAWDEDRAVGLISGHPRESLPVIDLPRTARIGDLFVADSHRGRGVGRSLVETFVGAVRQAGYPRVEVGTLTADARAMAFWQQVGFAPWQTLFSRD